MDKGWLPSFPSSGGVSKIQRIFDGVVYIVAIFPIICENRCHLRENKKLILKLKHLNNHLPYSNPL